MTKNKAIVEYMKTEKVLNRFADVLGEHEAKGYIASVLIAVQNDERLMACDPDTIYTSGLRAASLRLSVDPATGQAYLIPYGKVCTLTVGYKGLYDMAVRTGRYRYINVDKVYEGEEWVKDRMSGIHSLEGGKTGDKIIGWFASFQMGDYIKTLYMSIEEIHAHAKQYNPAGYNAPKGLWKKNPSVMERKTPLRILLMKWGYIAPSDKAQMQALDNDAYADDRELNAIEAEIKDKPAKKKKSVAENVGSLGFPTDHLPEEDHKPWPKKIVAAVRAKTHLQTEEEINDFLDDSGMGREATVAAVRIYSGLYQTKIKEDVLPHEAIEHARANWQNGGGK